ncbi:MAG: class I poly(R)-hydroxyalkanoic acid synthase [Rhodospirillaceae bacterium]|nr:class I poly(R)-hydroxyalkanoic acid synthase [Rhodospirillaceae bacterium]
MTHPNGNKDPLERAQNFSRSMASIADRSQRLVSDFIARNASGDRMDMSEYAHIGTAFMELTQKMMQGPSQYVEAQVNLWNDYMALWRNTTLKMLGEESGDPVIEPEKGDRRFKDNHWQENEAFDFIKQSYLLAARWMNSTVNDVEGLDAQTARKVDFYTRQFADAIAPTNFAVTNPEVLRATSETGGENLISGLENMLEDLEKGKGKLRISLTDEDAFDLGVNLAATPGKVVFQNDLIQLIHYEPTTDQQHSIPLLIIPPWINRYYILDLREKNSLVKWLTDQGYSTFIVSWVNPDGTLAHKSFEDYMLEGAIGAIEAVKKACRVKQVHVTGYCIGGTLLSATLAYLKAKGDDSVKTATFFNALTDFRDVGDIRAFIDEEQVEGLEKRMDESGGFLDGADMANTFNMLRSNDLIWSFVVNNYLLGKDPFPIDLLYWNSDSTRIPKEMHSFYLRNMYLENNLVKPGGISLAGEPIDLTTVDLPTYMISCKEDYIAPWASTYEATKLFKSKVRFVLSASGHIAGVVNPPAAEKYCFWTNTKSPESAEDWLATGKENPGSWWTDWHKWLKPKSGKKMAARAPGKGGLKVIENAPGSYCKVRPEYAD